MPGPFFPSFRSIRFTALLCLLATAPLSGLLAQQPVYKVDINQTGRPLAETNEVGYTPFEVPANTLDTATLVLNPATGLKISFIRKGGRGTKLSSNWFKNGIITPNFARLTCDGIRVHDGNDGAQIEVRISGLPAGRHSIMTYHNQVDNLLDANISPMDVYVNGVKEVTGLKASFRKYLKSEVPITYLYADAIPGQDVVLLFAADTLAGPSFRNVIINAIELNTPNAVNQARQPYPAHGDRHTDADAGNITLSWTNAPNAVASEVYYGFDSTSVDNATHSSPLYKGHQTHTTLAAGSQYSMDTYYWRVDQVDANGYVTRGNVWYYQPRQLAFRDAEGYGRFAHGGRGGKVVYVTNLNDAGSGSLREAVTNNIGPRTILFAVSGIITLKSRLVVSQNNITIAGQSAPGKGICIRSAPFGSGGNDLIIRHMRVRLGSGPTYDGMGMQGDHCIIDNSSISWTIDEAFSSRGAKNITLQRTLISEALNVAGHQNYPAGKGHGYAATISGYNGSFHHNLLAHNEGRNWSMGGALDGLAYYSGKLDIRNNVVYNWGNRTTDGGSYQVNFVNNYYKPGPATRHFYALTANHEGVGLGTQSYYVAGNVMPGRFDENNQDAGKRIVITNNAIVNWETWVNTPFFESYVNTQSAREAYKRVLSNVGANQPVFDDHDKRMVRETRDSTYTYVGSYTGIKGLIDSHTDAGGWEDYPAVKRAADWDSDLDGLPDWWERERGFNPYSAPNDFSDANNDADHDGYTQLEDYLEWMGGAHYFIAPGVPVEIDLSALASGFTNAPNFMLSKVTNGSAMLTTTSSNNSTNGTSGATGTTALTKVMFTPAAEGLAAFTFTVTDADGSTMERTVNLEVNATLAALPVRLLSFKANRENPATVALSWSTAQESNNSHFDVQRSFSATGPFTTIATMQSKATDGHSNHQLDYSLTDANDAASTTWYRLVQKDLDGRSSLSPVAIVKGTNRDFKVWPTPNNGRFHIAAPATRQQLVARLFAVDGKPVSTTRLHNGNVTTIQVANKGVYVLKISVTGGEELLTQLIVTK